MNRLHVLQHVPFEGPGKFADWALSRGMRLTTTAFYQTSDLPDKNLVDMLLIMGGPMGVNDDDQYPWLSAERRYIELFLATGKPVIGVCLGAQLLAQALGSRVYPHREKEIGWFPVKWSRHAVRTFGFSNSQHVLHWHGDTYDLPDAALHLAASECCEQQGFLLNRQVLALQFHMEATADTVKSLVEHERELAPGRFVQPANTILSQVSARCDAVNQQLFSMLNVLYDE